jgi:hypothetical protein
MYGSESQRPAPRKLLLLASCVSSSVRIPFDMAVWLLQMEESTRVVHDDAEVRQMVYRVQVLSRPTTLTAQVRLST